jgi:uncharacterized protein YndB with AHSA1/START domain
MPPTERAGAQSGKFMDRASRTITFTREFAADRERVFDAWTQPEQVAGWWDPSGARLAECQIDLRPGGAFKFVNASSHGGPPFGGFYKEVIRPERLVFEAMGAIGSVLLTKLPAGTLLTVTIECPTTEHFEHFLKLGVDVGTSQTLDNLVSYIHALAR